MRCNGARFQKTPCERGLGHCARRPWSAGGAITIEATIDQTDIPELSGAKGISVDVEGYLWVLQQGNMAYKIDRETYEYWIFNNPSSMYTYSDMTGFGLWNVNNPVG
jgi:hypothetical protein